MPPSSLPPLTPPAAREESAPFQQLLRKLAAEHDRVCSLNVALQAEVKRLLSASGTFDVAAEQGLTLTPQSAPIVSDRRKVTVRHRRSSPSCSKQIVSLDDELPDRADQAEVVAPALGRDSVEITIHKAPTCIATCEEGGAVVSPTGNAAVRGPPLFGRTEAPEASTASIEIWEVAASALLPALPGGRPSAATLSRSKSRLQALSELQPAWAEVDIQGCVKKLHSVNRSFSTKAPHANCIRGGDTLTEDNSCTQRFVMGPNAKRRVVWDLLSLIILGYDILLVPMVAFELPESIVLRAMDYTCTLFWTLDMPVSLITGYHDAGVLEMRPSMIARNYFRSWFFCDFLVICIDYLKFLTESGMADIVGLFRMSKVVRMVRLFRLFRLLRMLKMPSLMDELGDYIQSEHLFTAFGVMRSLMIIAIVNHFIACCWYAVGQWGNPGWVQTLDEENRTLGYRYATSLHWSLTQFTPSSMEIHPRNVLERVFSIWVLFGALVIFSSFVSSITNAMTQLHAANRQKVKQREDIRKYISDNKLSLELGNRIVAFVRKHRASSRKRVHEDEIQVLKVLPESLRLQLHWEVYLPVLLPHPFFFNLNEADEGCMLDICHNAMGEISVGSSQELFTVGQPSSKMYFIFSGLLEYYHEMSDCEMMEVVSGSWCSEAVLWLKWDHEGRLAAVSHCELVALDASLFRKFVLRWPKITLTCQDYARQFKALIDGNLIDQPVDIWSDHDQLLQMAHAAFGKCEPELDADEDDENKGPGPQRKHQLRPWRTLSLKRRRASAAGFSKSNSMP